MKIKNALWVVAAILYAGLSFTTVGFTMQFAENVIPHKYFNCEILPYSGGYFCSTSHSVSIVGIVLMVVAFQVCGLLLITNKIKS